MKVFHYEGHLHTSGLLDVRDVTDEVARAVRESGVDDGIACVYSPHTGCRFEVVDGDARGTVAALSRARPASGVLTVRDGEIVAGPTRRIRLVELAGESDRSWLLEVVGS